MSKARPDAEGHRNTEDFVLRNDPPRRKPLEFENRAGQQKVLFSGYKSCLPGQLDLFETDGQLPEE